MKLTVYIVDDEPMAVEYLEMLLKGTSLEIEVIGTAPNGAKAIPDIARLHPDFVFVDISMPVMDGLKMSEIVLEKNPDQKIFMLTAYRDFEYAKKSIKIGVKDYILKNELTEKNLEDLIQKNAADLIVERRQRHAIMQTNIRNFLLSDSMHKNEEKIVVNAKPLQQYIFIYITKKPTIVFYSRDKILKEYVDCYDIENSISDPEVACRAFVEIFRDEYCGIFYISSCIFDIEKKCEEITRGIINKLNQSEIEYVAIVSTPIIKFSLIPEVYAEFRKYSRYLYAEKKQIYWQNDYKRDKSLNKCLETEDNWSQKWIKYLKNEMPREAEQILIEKLTKMKKVLDVRQYTDTIKVMHNTFIHIMKEQNLSAECFPLLPEYDDIDVLEQDFLENQRRYFQFLKERHEKRYSRNIILALEYIHNNYKKDISVQDIALEVGISEGHLRRCFKTEMSMNVVTYLTEYRLRIAKELMRNKRENVDDIWKKTGFASAQYFSYVFKKNQGMSPREYIKGINHVTHESENNKK